MKNIKVKNEIISIIGINDDDYVSLTDLARLKNTKEPKDVVKNWLRTRSNLEYCGLWEQLNNENFNIHDYKKILAEEAGENSFTMSPTRWVSDFNAIGFKVKPTKNGGTYAHKDIALQFALWISADVQLYVIKEFQRLKIEESQLLEWHGERLLTKLNYLIQTDTIKEKLLIHNLTSEQVNRIYASEADLLNVSLFGKTANEWKAANIDKKGNIRDYANTIELAILSNLEYENSKLIKKNIDQQNRLMILNQEANREKNIFNKYNVKKIVKKIK